MSRYGAVAVWALGCATFLSAGLFVRSDDLQRTSAPGELRITLLAVGAGSCSVIELPDRRIFLVDAGSSTLTDPVERCIEPFLRSRGARRIDGLILSHANYDHFSAVFELLERYDVRDVYLAPQFLTDAATTPAAGRLMRVLRATGPPPRLLVAGDTIELSGQTRLEVIWPHQETRITPNESSLVLRLQHGSQRVLFTGDIEASAQQHLLADDIDLRTDVLVAPHHGSFEATTPAFLEACAPRWVVSSNGRRLSQRQRDFDRLVTVPHLRTHSAGAITITIAADGALGVSGFRAVAPVEPASPAF